MRLDAMHTRRSLQSFQNMFEQRGFYLRRGATGVMVDEQVADHALAALVDEEAESLYAPALDGGIAGQDLGVHVAQHHLGRAGVVPTERTHPLRRLLIKERPQVSRRKMPEIEDFQFQSWG